MSSLSQVSQVSVQQQKEWGEILTGYETKNKYVVKDGDGRELFFAAEIAGNVFLRLFLKAARPFEIVCFDPQRIETLRFKRPFRFLHPEITVMDARGKKLGRIKERFSVIRRIYSVYDEQGLELYRLVCPVFKSWTFFIEQNGERVGKICKRWSGLIKEGFTDADNFSVEFPPNIDEVRKSLLLGAVFLIDFVYFESR